VAAVKQQGGTGVVGALVEEALRQVSQSSG
jgi:hypothetical protein